MIDINELRSMVNGAQFESFANSVINALLDRLEATEKAVAEAYQRGYSTGQEELEKERDALRVENAGLVDDMNLLRTNNATLCAKITAMEKQEPVWFIDERGEPKKYHKSKADYCKYGGLDLLYALPGAKGE